MLYHRFANATEPINASLRFVQDGEHEKLTKSTIVKTRTP